MLPFSTIASRTTRARLLVIELILSKSASGSFGRSDIKERFHGNSQCRGDQVDIDEANVALAALDTADICAVKPTSKRQSFLREPLILTQFPNAGSKAFLNPVFLLGWHYRHTNSVAAFRSTDFTSLLEKIKRLLMFLRIIQQSKKRIRECRMRLKFSAGFLPEASEWITPSRRPLRPSARPSPFRSLRGAWRGPRPASGASRRAAFRLPAAR